jgi:hypothetical protein
MIGLSLATEAVLASELHFESTVDQTSLLELYTSEGCSSCPPAESWLSRLRDSPALWKDFVPMAFHVDYWDYLGWRDPWSSSDYSARQRAYSQIWRAETIYTPGFVVDGKEWRTWSQARIPPRSALRPGVLIVTTRDTNHWQVTFGPDVRPNSSYLINAALLASGLGTDVKAGENRGRHLTHDFVVLEVHTAALTLRGDSVSSSIQIDPRRTKQGGRLAAAFWVNESSSPAPLQATGGWLEPGK